MLKQITYFQSVVKNGSFSKAAAENFISQSAISQQIQTLERELGFPLLERKNRSFTLTPAGEYFYQKSLVLTADYKRMCMEAARIAKGKQAVLKIGYLRCSYEPEFARALEQFSAIHPDVTVSLKTGNHEELYALLRTGQADLVLNDQRRAFSDEYVNLILAARSSFIEIPASSPLALLNQITPEELKNFPCILVSSPSQRETERDYYQTVLDIQSEFLYAESLEEARFLAIGKHGFFPVDAMSTFSPAGPSFVRIPLVRGNQPILKNFCAFWKTDNSGFYIEEFAELLKFQFQE